MFVVCCKNFVDFQIELYVIENSVPLTSVVYNYAQARVNVDVGGIDFDYSPAIDYDSDSDNDESSNKQQTNYFVSSVCYWELRTTTSFVFDRFV